MANIDTELQTIATSVYGSEMRGAIHDAIEKVNDDVDDLSPAYTLHGTFGTQGTTHFFGTYDIIKRFGIATINIDIGIDYTVPYVRPSGTIVDNTGLLLFTLPLSFNVVVNSGKIGMYPIADDRYNNDIPYLSIALQTGEVRLFYGWDDVITENGTGYELIVNHTYICNVTVPD